MARPSPKPPASARGRFASGLIDIVGERIGGIAGSLIPAASPAPSDAPGSYFGDRATASATLGRATRYNKIAVEVGVSPATVRSLFCVGWGWN